MMLEPFAAHFAHEFLQSRDMGNRAIPECVERIVREFALSHICANATVRIGRGDSTERKRASRCAALECAIGILDAQNASQYWRIGDFYVGQEALCPIAAV